MTVPQQVPQQASQARPEPPPPFTVIPQPGDKTDDLLSRLDAADAALEAARSYRDSVDAALKLHLTSLIPKDPATGQLTASAVEVAATATHKARRLSWSARRTFDKDRYIATFGKDAYESWLKWGKGFWGWRDVR